MPPHLSICFLYLNMVLVVMRDLTHLYLLLCRTVWTVATWAVGAFEEGTVGRNQGASQAEDPGPQG